MVTTGSQTEPAVASLASGGFVVSWTDTSGQGGDASSTAVKAQLFDASGARAGAEFLVNTATSGLQAVSAVTGLASGGFVVSWTDASGAGGDASGRAVKAQVFDASGARVGGELLVNTATSGDQQKPSLTALPSGVFLLSWLVASGDASGSAVKAQLFDDHGVKVGGEFLVNSSTAGAQFDPSVTLLASGGIVVAWNDQSGQGGDADGGIRAQLFRPVAIEQVSYDLKGTIQIDDPDTGAGSMTVTLSVDYGILAVTAGGTAAGVAGSGTNMVTITGTLAQIQALLGSDATSAIAFLADSDDPPRSATLQVVVDDNGNSGTDPGLTGGPASEQAAATLQIDIVGINDAPSGADSVLAIDEDQAHIFTMAEFGFSDPENGGLAAIVVTSLPGAGSLKLDGNAVSAGSMVSAAAIAEGRLVYAPASNASGAGYASLTFQVKDDGGTFLGGVDIDATPNSISFDVAPVNDAPAISYAPLRPVGPEFLANAVVTNTQSEPWVSSLSSGGFVLCWRSFGPNPAFDDIKGQIFDASGAKVGGEFLVNTVTAFSQIQPSVTGLASGGFVVTWQDAGSSPSTIKARLYDASGAALGGEQLVSTNTGGSQQQPAVTALPSGGFVVTWSDFAAQDVKAQLFDASGAKVGTEFVVNMVTTGSQTEPAVASLSSGGFVVSWTDTSGQGGDASSTAVMAQLFDASGARVGAEFLVNTATSGLQAASAVTGLASGGFVVSWTDASAQGGDASGRAVKAQVFDASGAKVGGELLVNMTTSGDQQKPSLAALPSGGFLVTWQDASGDASGGAVKAQMFDDHGAKVGAEFLVNSSTAGAQFDPSVTLLASGGIIVAWSDQSGQGGDADGGIKAQILFPHQTAEQGIYDLKNMIGVGDVDAGASTITITLSVDSGSLTAVAGTSGALVAGSGTASVRLTGQLGQLQALLGSDATSILTFRADGDNPTAGAVMIVLVDDGQDSATVTIPIGISPINDPPTLSGFDATVTFAENEVNAVPALLDASVTFADPEDNLAGGRLTITGLLAEDRIGILNEGIDPGQIGVSGSNVAYGGLVIGSFSGGNGNAFTVVFNASATSASVEALIEHLTYANVSDTPTVSRDLHLNVIDADGLGLGGLGQAISVNVTPEGEAPVNHLPSTLSGVEDEQVSFANGIFIDPPPVLVSDADSAVITARLTAMDGSFTSLVTGAASVTGIGTNDITISGTVEDVNRAIYSIVYTPVPNGNGLRTIIVTTSDGVYSDTDTIAVTIQPVNDAPSGADQVRIAIADESYQIGAGDFGFSDPADGNSLLGVVLVSIPAHGQLINVNGFDRGVDTDGDGRPDLVVRVFVYDAGDSISAADLQAGYVRYAPDPGVSGDAADSFSFLVRDDGGTGSGGVDLDPISHVFTFGVDARPVVDLNGAAAGVDHLVSYTENGAAVPIGVTIAVTDADPDDLIDHATVTLANAQAGDALSYGALPAGISASVTMPAGAIVITLSGAATPAAYAAAIATIAFSNDSDDPAIVDRTIIVMANDGTADSLAATATIHVIAQDDPAVAQADAISTNENATVNVAVLANDSDPDNPLLVIKINGTAIAVGGTLTLASGATVKLEANGTLTYDPNHKFDTLTSTSTGEIGAVNTSALDSFTYTLGGAGGGTATVNITVNGVASPEDHLDGDAGNNNITGTGNGDFFDLDQGGIDTVSGLGGNDVFLFGTTLTAADSVDGGAGTDQVAIQGNYIGVNGLTLGTGVVSIESLAILPGSDTRFGDPGTNFYSYNITTVDQNVAPGVQMTVDANRLRAGENFTFNGAAELDGSFFIYGGMGVDLLTGGSQNDVFLFGTDGGGSLRWGSSDQIIGGAGIDQLALRGDYSITFGATQLLSIESMGLVSAYDTRFGALGAHYSYNLTMNDGNVAAGQQMTVDGATLRPDEILTFNGSAEQNGSFRVFGGTGNDAITGSSGNDILSGGLGADTLTGNAGADRFLYRNVADSTPAGRDGIQDFASGDIIDLSGIDAIAGGANDAFTFIGAGSFTNHAGELQAVNSAGPIWTISGDTDGDGAADFQLVVVVTDAHPITSIDFNL
jgi:hypothetical protein